MRKEDQIPARPWQARWWREDAERWRWAGTILIVFVLMGVFAYRNPEVWHHDAPLTEAASQQTADEANQPTTLSLSAEIPEPPTPEDTTVQENLPASATAPAQQVSPASTVAPEPEGPEDEVVAVSAPPSTWQPPASGSWTRGYGYGLDPTLGDYRFHSGCDMDLAEGSPVFAAASGRVIQAADDAAWGGLVVIEHGGGWRSVYKCIRPSVKAGTDIFAGEPVGTVLASPPAELAESSHLHFEMALDNDGQDPQQWL